VAQPFSMIRAFHLADWFTLANAMCGTGAIFAIMEYNGSNQVRHVYIACALVCLALVFDILDGHIARWSQNASALGRELDSLSDMISFGIVPTMIGFSIGMQGLWDRVALAYFVACGVSRLARYNLTAAAMVGPNAKVRQFEGTPIPTSLLLVLLLTIAAANDAVGSRLWLGEIVIADQKLHPFVLLFVLFGSLMISRIPIPKP
jgi:CDP-diacylglycerol---serine O-phosphatidyltransferase